MKEIKIKKDMNGFWSVTIISEDDKHSGENHHLELTPKLEWALELIKDYEKCFLKAEEERRAKSRLDKILIIDGLEEKRNSEIKEDIIKKFLKN